MWTISQLKDNGKANFKKNYLYSVIAAVVLGVCDYAVTGATSRSTSSTNFSEIQAAVNEMDPALLFTLIVAIISVVSVVLCIGLAVRIFFFDPMLVGVRRFFITNRVKEKAELTELIYGLKNNFWGNVLTMFLMRLYQYLWTCLFIIPGIIKGYSYRLVPYILADNQGLSGNDAITLSRKMMNGNKWKAFVYDLSFIGWFILTACTCGILGLFYVAPYKAASDAEFYTAVKETYNPVQ